MQKSNLGEDKVLQCICAPAALSAAGFGGCSLLLQDAVVSLQVKEPNAKTLLVELPLRYSEEDLDTARQCRVHFHTEGTDHFHIEFERKGSAKRAIVDQENNVALVYSRFQPANLYHCLIAPAGLFKVWTAFNAALQLIFSSGYDVFTGNASSPTTGNRTKGPPVTIWAPWDYAIDHATEASRYRVFHELVFGRNIVVQHGATHVTNSKYTILGIWKDLELVRLIDDKSGAIKTEGQEAMSILMRSFRDHLLTSALARFGDTATLADAPPSGVPGEGRQKPILYHRREFMRVADRYRGIDPKLEEELKFRLVNFYDNNTLRGDDERISQYLVTETFNHNMPLEAQIHSIRSRRIILAGEGAFLTLMLFARPETVFVQVWHPIKPGSWNSGFYKSLALLLHQPLITYETEGSPPCFSPLPAFQQTMGRMLQLLSNSSNSRKNMSARVYPEVMGCNSDLELVTKDFPQKARPGPRKKIACICAPTVFQNNGDGGCSLLLEDAVVRYEQNRKQKWIRVELPENTTDEEISIAKGCDVRFHLEMEEQLGFDFIRTPSPARPLAEQTSGMVIVYGRFMPANLYHTLIAPTSLFKAWTVMNAALDHMQENRWLASNNTKPKVEFWHPYSYWFDPEKEAWKYRPFYEFVFGDDVAENLNRDHITNCKFTLLGLWKDFELMHWIDDHSGNIKEGGQHEMGELVRRYRQHIAAAALKKYGDVPPLRSNSPNTTNSNQTEAPPATPVLYHHRGYDKVPDRYRGIEPGLQDELKYRLARVYSTEPLARGNTSAINAIVSTESSNYNVPLKSQIHSIRSRRMILAGEGAFFPLMLFARPETIFVQVWHPTKSGSWNSGFHKTLALFLQQPMLTYETDGSPPCFPPLKIFDEKLKLLVDAVGLRAHGSTTGVTASTLMERVYPANHSCNRDLGTAASNDGTGPGDSVVQHDPRDLPSRGGIIPLLSQRRRGRR